MENVYFKKKGNKYIPVPTYEINGVGEGLWLITKTKDCTTATNMLHLSCVHNLQNVGKFSDFYKAHKEELTELVKVEYERFIQTKREKLESFSLSELTDCIISALSKVD